MAFNKFIRIGTIVLGLASVGTLFQNCAKDLPNIQPTSSDASSTGEDPAPDTGGAVVAGPGKAIIAIGTATQTATLTTVGGTWANVPGAAITFALSENRTIHLSAMGSVQYVLGNQSTSHCGFRFVVNGKAYGDPTWGDLVVQIGNWTNWRTERHISLNAGTYTAQLQQVGWVGTSAGCTSSAVPHSAGRMTITAY